MATIDKITMKIVKMVEEEMVRVVNRINQKKFKGGASPNSNNGAPSHAAASLN